MKIQVYTANVGQYHPTRIEKNGLKVFTEDRLGDPLLSARFYKTCPYLLFPYADWTIWIDANVWLNVSPEELIRKAQEKTYHKSFGVFKHTFHKDVYEESCKVLEGNFDTPSRVERSLGRRSNLQLREEQAMTMVLVRRNTQKNRFRDAAWWQDICYGSRRDQLSSGLHYPGPHWDMVDFTKPNKYFTRIA